MSEEQGRVTAMGLLTEAAQNLQDAREQLQGASGAAQDAVVIAHAEGIPETVIAKTLSVNRLTVRRWLRKGRP